MRASWEVCAFIRNHIIAKVLSTNLAVKEKVDYFLEKSQELDINFNIYQDILQSIRHNNFKRFENIVKKNLAKKEKLNKC